MSRELYKRTIAPHNQRVGVDGGVPSDNVQAALLLIQDTQKYIDAGTVRELMNPELFGTKQRSSAPYLYATKAYSANSPQGFAASNDLAQTTANSQPYLSKIAPAEPQGLLNQNGDSRFMSHSAVSFAAGDKWTVEMVLNWNGSNNAIVSLIGKPSDTLTSLSIKKTTTVFSFTNESGTAVDGTVSTASLIGKAKVLHLEAAGNGTLKIYVDGVLFDTITNPTNVTLTQIFAGQATASRNYYGKFYHDLIIADSLDISYRSALLRSIFPEIPTTKVAGLDCAVRALDIVCTPAGNLIPEMQLASTTQLITNADNRTFTNWANVTWAARNGSTIADGGGKMQITMNGTMQNGAILSLPPATIGKWYKVSADIWNGTSINTSYFMQFGGTLKVFTVNSVQTNYSWYIQASSTNQSFFIVSTGVSDTGTFFIDNASCEEVGWSGLTDLYNGLIAQGQTAAQAQAAVSAYCHHSNDLALGSVYGKIYNGYAKDLLVSELASSNFGYHVATEAEWTAILAAGVNNLKMTGTGFWTTANGTNLTGLTIMGGAFRSGATGIFDTIKTSISYWCSDSLKRVRIFDDGTYNISNVGVTDAFGYYILLIKNY